MTYETEWIERRERLAEIEPAWDALAEREPYPSLRHAWIAAWWDGFGGGRRLAVPALWNGGELAAVFPLAERAGRLESLSNNETPVCKPFARSPHALAAVAAAALERRPPELVSAVMPAGSDAVGAVCAASRAAGRPAVVERQQTSPVVDLGGSFDDYFGNLGRNTREQLPRRRRSLEREHGTRFRLVERPEDVDAELERAFALEASGWKGRAKTAIAASEPMQTFYRSLAERFHAQDRLRLSTIEADGRLLAFQLCLLDHSRLWFLKGAYDESFARYTPGLLLALAQVERCYELGLRGYELLGGDEPYKLRLATSGRTHVAVRSYARRPAPLARYAYRRAARPLLKRLYRTVRSRRRR